MTDQRHAAYAGALLVWQDAWNGAEGRKPSAAAFGLDEDAAREIERGGAEAWRSLAAHLPEPLRHRSVEGA